MKKLMLLAAGALLMTSCGIYNKYERPEVNTTGLVRDVQSNSDTLAVSDTTSFGNLAWRTVFTDPQLQSLIELGLQNNTNMLNAALNVKMVEDQLMVAKLAFVPGFTLLAARHHRFVGRQPRYEDLLAAYHRIVEHRPLRQRFSTRSVRHRWRCSPRRTISS